jgi:hypothetical protein
MYLYTDNVRQVFIKHQITVDNNPVQKSTAKEIQELCKYRTNFTGAMSQLYISMATSVHTSRHFKTTIKD